MNPILIKLLITIPLVLIWGFLTLTTVKYCITIWRVRNVDTQVALRLMKNAVTDTLPKNPLSTLAEGVRERRTVKVTWDAVKGLPMILADGATISGDTLKGRTQYRLQIENDTEDVFRQMNWRLQTPYPVEAISFSRSEKCVDPRLVDDQPWVFEGGGSAKVQGRPMSRLKRVFIAELEPKGVVELLLVLNTKSEVEFSPSLTFVFADYRALIQKESFDREFYSALTVIDEKVVMDSTIQRPPKLTEAAMDLEF